MTLFVPVNRTSASPVTERPDPARLLSGDPVHTSWNVEDRDGLYCGLWHSTPGKWRVSYSEWEYFRMIEGVSIVTDDNGVAVNLKAGDSWIIRPGFVGTWEVCEATLKDYVIRL